MAEAAAAELVDQVLDVLRWRSWPQSLALLLSGLLYLLLALLGGSTLLSVAAYAALIHLGLSVAFCLLSNRGGGGGGSGSGDGDTAPREYVSPEQLAPLTVLGARAANWLLGVFEEASSCRNVAATGRLAVFLVGAVVVGRLVDGTALLLLLLLAAFVYFPARDAVFERSSAASGKKES